MKKIVILLAGLSWLWAGGLAMAQSNQNTPLTKYWIEPLSPRGKTLESARTVWKATGQSAGGYYQLQSISSISQSGSGCCCLSYLPLILK
jgi:hypothetical protein